MFHVEHALKRFRLVGKQASSLRCRHLDFMSYAVVSDSAL